MAVDLFDFTFKFIGQSEIQKLSDDLYLACIACFSIYFLKELSFSDYADGWETRWVQSDWKKDENMAGEWNHTSGKWNGSPEDKGVKCIGYR